MRVVWGVGCVGVGCMETGLYVEWVVWGVGCVGSGLCEK